MSVVTSKIATDAKAHWIKQLTKRGIAIDTATPFKKLVDGMVLCNAPIKSIPGGVLVVIFSTIDHSVYVVTPDNEAVSFTPKKIKDGRSLEFEHDGVTVIVHIHHTEKDREVGTEENTINVSNDGVVRYRIISDVTVDQIVRRSCDNMPEEFDSVG